MASASIGAADASALRVNVGHGGEESGPSCPNLDFDRDNEVVCMPTQCPACGAADGETRMLLTSIPMFREVIVASFSCGMCGHSNQSVDFAGAYQEQGSRIELRVQGLPDLQRQVVKSDSCCVFIPEIEFEIQPNPDHKRGVFSTLQGVLQQAVEGIDWMVWNWRQQIPQQPENTDTILGLLNDLSPKKLQIEKLLTGEIPFRFILDDPAGNSFVSSSSIDSQDDPQLAISKYERTEAQNNLLGFSLERDQAEQDGVISSSKPLNTATVPKGAGSRPKVTYDESAWLKFEPSAQLDEAVMQFPAWCEACGASITCNMYQFAVPHFREVILMSATCDFCGNKSREIKPGGAVPPLGRRCTLNFEKPTDLRRGVRRAVGPRLSWEQVIKSDSAAVEIPEIELEMQPGTLGGMFTTVEGLLLKIREHLIEANPFGSSGDGRDTLLSDTELKFREFLAKLETLEKGDTPFTLIVADAMAGSFIENPLAPAEDRQLFVEDYERSYEENEDLGLNQMKTEDYEGASPAPAGLIVCGCR